MSFRNAKIIYLFNIFALTQNHNKFFTISTKKMKKTKKKQIKRLL